MPAKVVLTLRIAQAKRYLKDHWGAWLEYRRAYKLARCLRPAGPSISRTMECIVREWDGLWVDGRAIASAFPDLACMVGPQRRVFVLQVGKPPPVGPRAYRMPWLVAKDGWLIAAITFRAVFENPSDTSRVNILARGANAVRFRGADGAAWGIWQLTQPKGGVKPTVTSTVVSGGGSASFATSRLSFPTPDTAVFSPSWGARALWSLVFVAGCVSLLYALPMSIRERSVGGLVLSAVIGVSFAAIGGIGLFVGFGVRCVIFDRRQATIVVTRGLGVRSTTLPLYAFRDIAAVQLCSQYVERDDPGYTTYELNLILTEPAGERLKLTSHADESRVRADAQRLAHFLEKPLLDHTYTRR
jgi:hypothetical protein